MIIILAVKVKHFYLLLMLF